MTFLQRTQQPWDLFNQLHRELNPSSASNRAEHWAPAVDIRETDSAYVIHADIPGVKPDDIEVKVDKGVLTISGKRESLREEKDKTWHRVERNYGKFMRSFSLPETINEDAVDARYNDGVLEVEIPKAENRQPRKINVKH